MMHLKDGMCGGNAFTESLKEGSLAELSKRTETLYGLPDTHVGCQRESEKPPRRLTVGGGWLFVKYYKPLPAGVPYCALRRAYSVAA